MPSSWSRERLVWNVIHTARDCDVTPAELDDRAQLRYGVHFRDLTNDQLREELKVLEGMKKRRNEFPITFHVPDERTAAEVEWDNEVMNPMEVWL